MEDVDYKEVKIEAIVRDLKKSYGELIKSIAEGGNYDEAFVDMFKLLNKLKAAQRTTTTKKETRIEPKVDWKPFIKWLKDNQYPNVEDFETTHTPDVGYGLLAKKDYNKGDMVLQVPLKFMMTNRTSLDTKLSVLLHGDELLQGIYSLSLAMHLLLERITLNSFWSVYINTLPKKLNSPLFWSLDEIQSIKGTYTHLEIVKLIATAVKQYTHIYSRLAAEKQLEFAIIKRSTFTFEMFAWAYATVLARQNEVKIEGAGGKLISCCALIPVFDLLNHEVTTGVISSDYDPEGQVLKCFAPKEIKKGDEIKIFYGPRSNTEFLCYQGFTIPNNSAYNWTAVKFSLSDKDKLKDAKIELLKPHQIGASNYFALSMDTPVIDSLLFFLRVSLVNNEEDMKKVFASATTSPYTLQQESLVLSILQLKLDERLKILNALLEQFKEKTSKSVNDKNLFQLLQDEFQIITASRNVTASKFNSNANKLKKKQQQKAEEEAKTTTTTDTAKTTN
eukprot:TRINITY_DN705_c0_g1_i1.p1 TRINITY_DN705_c0_g1~~TRINITY_DN705_c0_g1_i1.p1  ORF type:complete len:504 (+),score=144.70 TRINITY_DN705_c0_g1_i1:728-2239(+)